MSLIIDSATSGDDVRAVSWSMPARTSVVSLNITVAPARTSRSVQKPTAGFAVTPLKASLPLHSTPTTSALAGQVSRRPASRRTRCASTVAMIDSIIDMKPTCASSCRQTTSKSVDSGAFVDGRAGPPQASNAPLGSRRRRRLGGQDRERARQQRPFQVQFFTTHAHHHHLPTEARVQRDVAQGADRDDRNGRDGRNGRVGRDTAAVRVLEPDHIVDVRVTRPQPGLDAPDREVEHTGHALHRGRDREDVARADRAVGVARALSRYPTG